MWNFNIQYNWYFSFISSQLYFQPYVSLWKESLLYFGTFEIMAEILNAVAIAWNGKELTAREISSVGAEN